MSESGGRSRHGGRGAKNRNQKRSAAASETRNRSGANGFERERPRPDGDGRGSNQRRNFSNREKMYSVETGEVRLHPSKFGAALKEAMNKKELIEGKVIVVK